MTPTDALLIALMDAQANRQLLEQEVQKLRAEIEALKKGNEADR